MLTVKIVVAEKIRFGVVLPEHTFLLYASCLLFLQLGEELLSMTTDLDRRLGADVLCKTPGSLSILSHRTVGQSWGAVRSEAPPFKVAPSILRHALPYSLRASRNRVCS